MPSLQAIHAPDSICFGCGPNNPNGLRIESTVDQDSVICTWTPQPYHHAFPNVLNGGIIGTILDCHCNWAAAHYLMIEYALETLPCTVTAQYQIDLLKPTPVNQSLFLRATCERIDGKKAVIRGELSVDGQCYDRCLGTFVWVGNNHPAAHRWPGG